MDAVERPEFSTMNLTDECESMSRSREAIVAGVLAWCTQAVATEPAKLPQLGNLLKSGWGLSSMVEDSTVVQDTVVVPPVAHSVPPVMQGPVDQTPLIRRAVNRGAVGTPLPAAARGASTISNPVRASKGSELDSEKVDRPDVPSSGQRSHKTAQTTAAGNPEVGRLHHRPDFETLQIERAPSVPRLQPRRPIEKEYQRGIFDVESQARVVVANPIDADGLPSRALAGASPVMVEVENTGTTDTVCDLVDVDAPDSTRLSLNGWKHKSAESKDATSPAGLSSTEGLPELDAVASFFNELQVADDQDCNAKNGDSLQTPTTAVLPPNTAKLSLPESEQPTRGVPPESKVAVAEPHGLIESTEVASVDPVDPLRRAAELWELAQLTLQQARHSARDGNTLESRASALEAFRLCVTALDVAEQTHSCIDSFKAAVDAVRESHDFCVTVESMGEQQVQQTILKHKTAVLKTRPFAGLSGHEAAFHYLTFARCELVKAAKGIPEASEALMLLGAAEAERMDGDASYRNAIAVMLQRAAIEICPADYERHLALGITLLRQGLPEQARLSLQRSIEIRPTRKGYQGLIELAMHSGDQALVETLRAQLNEIAPSTEAIARDFRNDDGNSDAARVTVLTVEKEKESDSKSKPRIGWRTLFPFIR
jgi:tetratricopeptide (TPR) repeat protein